MITMEQFLENNSEQEGICIAVYGKEQYDEFMKLLYDNGYTWHAKPPAKLELENIIHKKDDQPFLMLIYLDAELKKLSQVHCFDEIYYENNDFEWAFDDCEGSFYIIKPYRRLKYEIKELELC